MRIRRREPEVESHKALEDADRHVQKAKERDPEVKETVRQLRLIRERNHFSEQLGLIMGGGRG